MKKFYLVPCLLFLTYQTSFAADLLAKGKEIYQTCVPCHGPSGAGNQEQMAPAIAGMDEWYVLNQLERFRSGARGLHPEDKGGHRMRPLARTLNNQDEIKAVATYVASLAAPDLTPTLEGGRPLKGRDAYAVCAGCHGMKAEGMEAPQGPRLTQTNDWYLLTQLKNFKAKIRGGDMNKDPLGATMASMAASLQDEQAMKDVIAYIQSLR